MIIIGRLMGRWIAKLHELGCHERCGPDCPDRGRWWCRGCGVDRVTQPHQDACPLNE